MIERDGRRPAGSTLTTGSALGTGLLVFGSVVAVLVILWLLTYAVQGALSAGGVIFGLILLAVLALPLLGAGWYLRRSGASEAAETQALGERRSVLDADRVVRRELTREIQQVIESFQGGLGTLPAESRRSLETAVQRLRNLADAVSQPSYDATTFLESPQIDARTLETMRRYDDLVLEEARQLNMRPEALTAGPEAAQRLAQGVETLAAHVREREELLGRGRRAAEMAPQELLRAGAAPRRALEKPLDLRLNDAVSYELGDYLVRAVLAYFAGGQTWRTYQLYDGQQERWLEVRAGGANVSWYEPAQVAGTPADQAITLDGETFSAQEGGSATVTMESAAGRQDGVFVEYRRYQSGTGDRLVMERWPDGPRALRGRGVAPEDLQLWTRTEAAE